MDRVTRLRMETSPSPYMLGATFPNPNNISPLNDAENCRLDMSQTKNLLEYIATDSRIKKCEDLKYWATLIADFITFWQRECGTTIHPLLHSMDRGDGRLVTLAIVLSLMPNGYQDYIFIKYKWDGFVDAEDHEFLREVSKNVQLEVAKGRERRMTNGGEGEWV